MPLKVVVVVDAAALLGQEQRGQEQHWYDQRVNDQEDDRRKLQFQVRETTADDIRHRVEGGDSEGLVVRAVDRFQA